ncbi:hypothetical protein F4809DRAFT_639470 [Biscogniauxia mediterranea]|nr:hypothetical protein F4809DRAFT_639470 [Biscogniauxia mediterranea]
MSQPARIRPYEAPNPDTADTIDNIERVLGALVPNFTTLPPDSSYNDRVNNALRALEIVSTFRQLFSGQEDQAQEQNQEQDHEEGGQETTLSTNDMVVLAYCREVLINDCLVSRVVPGLYADKLHALTGAALQTHVAHVAALQDRSRQRQYRVDAQRQCEAMLEAFWGDRRSGFQLDYDAGEYASHDQLQQLMFTLFPDSARVYNVTDRAGWDDPIDAKLGVLARRWRRRGAADPAREGFGDDELLRDWRTHWRAWGKNKAWLAHD